MSVLLRFLEDADLDQLFKWGAIHMRLRWRPLPEPIPLTARRSILIVNAFGMTPT